jgi:hypothetical protein
MAASSRLYLLEEPFQRAPVETVLAGLAPATAPTKENQAYCSKLV